MKRMLLQALGRGHLKPAINSRHSPRSKDGAREDEAFSRWVFAAQNHSRYTTIGGSNPGLNAKQRRRRSHQKHPQTYRWQERTKSYEILHGHTDDLGWVHDHLDTKSEPLCSPPTTCLKNILRVRKYCEESGRRIERESGTGSFYAQTGYTATAWYWDRAKLRGWSRRTETEPHTKTMIPIVHKPNNYLLFPHNTIV